MDKIRPTSSQIIEIVLTACSDHNQIAEPKRQIHLNQGVQALLYGKEGVLDSLGLVSLLVAIEQSVEDLFGTQVTLASEKAFSQTQSPFQSVGSLGEYILQLLSTSPENP